MSNTQSPPISSSAGTKTADEKPKTGMNREIQLFSSSKPKPFPIKDLIKFYRGVASMIKAQINTSDALKYYANGLPNKGMADVLIEVKDNIHSGMSIYESFTKSKRFDEMSLGLIKAGMDSGRLDAAFMDLADRAEIQLGFKKKLRKIFLIPCFVFPVLILAFLYTQIKVVPQIRDMVVVGDFVPEGPVTIFFTVSDATIAGWPFALTILASIIGAFLLSKKLRKVALNIAMSKIRMLRMLIMGLRQVTFLGVIKLLHGNGINMAKAIRTSATSVKGTEFHDELLTAADQYEKAGVPLAIAFSKYTSVDDQVVHMLSIGEKSASMGEQLKMLTTMYEDDCEQYMEDFTNVLNFFVLLIAVSMVAFVFLGVFMPIFLMGPEMMNSAM